MNILPAKMLCLVKQPNSVSIEIEVDSKNAVGQDCLDKVLSHLGIIEADYFGLQYTGSKGEQLWLNLRNPLSRQLHGSAPPYRLQLKVKFFVQPHFLLQDTTRHQFFLNVKHDLISGRLRCPDVEHLAELVGLIAQAEFGDFSPQRAHLRLVQYGALLPESQKDMSILSAVICQHERHRGLTERSAKYRAIQVASSLEDYGMEYHQVVNMDTGASCRMGVGPSGITVTEEDSGSLQERIEFQGLHTATHDGRQLTLCLICDDASTVCLNFRLVTQRAASALYRSVTEMHSFYRCDTVRNAVASQVCRDLKGTLAALFSDNSTLGQKYVFDIQRTMREAHDYARRVLYSMDQQQQQPIDEVNPEADDAQEGADFGLAEATGGATAEVMETEEQEPPCTSSHCQELRNSLAHVRDVFICQICADAPLNTAFTPCGHVVCCTGCASRMTFCPLCRSAINHVQPIFLPNLPPLKASHPATSSSSSVQSSSAICCGSSLNQVFSEAGLTLSAP